MKKSLFRYLACALIVNLSVIPKLHATLTSLTCVTPVGLGNICTSDDSTVGTASSNISEISDQGSMNSTTSAAFTVSYGFISGSAITSLTNNSTGSGYADSLSQGTWSEDWIVMNPDDPALIGTTGTGAANVSVSASPSATESNSIDTGTANASWTLDFSISSASVSGVEGSADSEGNLFPGPSFISLPFDFVWGQTFLGPTVSFRALTMANGVANSTGNLVLDAMVDFSSTITWAGLTDIQDSNGNPVEFTVSSASGTDWTSPIPIPPAVWLFVSGLLGLIGISRRKKAA